MRLDMGYCGSNAESLIKTLRLKAHTIGEKIPFCLRMINKESFPVVVQLSFMKGFTTEEGTEVCSMPFREQGFSGDHFFKREDKRCRKTSLTIQPGDRGEIQGEWMYQPSDNLASSKKGENSTKMVACVLGRGLSIEQSDSHKQKMHIKSGRMIHMVRIEGPMQKKGVSKPKAPTFHDTHKTCNPL